jgi:hypothetical protein
MEFITHPAVTRIFKTDIDVYSIKSITVDENDICTITIDTHGTDLVPPMELVADIKHAAITAKYEDEAHQDRYEDSDTIQAALSERSKK